MDDISFVQLTDLALKHGCRIGIGCDPAFETVAKSIEKCRSMGLDLIKSYTNPEDLVNDLVSGRIDAAVRGNMPAADMIGLLKPTSGQNKILRLALLKTASGKYFFMAPIGIDEGNDPEEKVELVKHSAEFCKAFGINVRIGVLSGGRQEDLGRSNEIDDSLKNAEMLDNKLRSLGYNSMNHGILIEDAVLRSNLLLVPDGIIGNYIFRTLYHLGEGDSIGAPAINIPMTFIDTSRTKRDYSSAIILAAAVHNARR